QAGDSNAAKGNVDRVSAGPLVSTGCGFQLWLWISHRRSAHRKWHGRSHAAGALARRATGALESPEANPVLSDAAPHLELTGAGEDRSRYRVAGDRGAFGQQGDLRLGAEEL